MNRLWNFYEEVVHTTLFIELLRHDGGLAALLTSIEDVVEGHGALVALSLGILFPWLRRRIGELWKAEPPPKRTKKAQPRGKDGRFAKPPHKRKEKR